MGIVIQMGEYLFPFQRCVGITEIEGSPLVRTNETLRRIKLS